ncbi:MAG: helix-turn-helix domain-containing protein [Nitrospirae bacterium]|nr:helix-turn-helix domain-containing protein [Nitrospirota bacterium]
MEQYIDIKQLSEALQTPVSTLYYWKSIGKIGFTKIGRKILFNKQEIETWLKGYSTSQKNEAGDTQDNNLQNI